MERWIIGLLVCLFLPGAPLLAQTGMSRYEMQYGEPVDVSLTDLELNPGSYEMRAVRTRGKLEMDGGLRAYALRSSLTGGVAVIPVREVEAAFGEAATKLLGREVEMTGVFTEKRRASQDYATNRTFGTIQFWSFLGPPEEPKKKDIEKMPATTLEELVTRADRYEGRMVKVVGQFRGKNLFGDLPSKSMARRGDWVIKDDLYAVWVTGKKPKGDGFDLDPGLKRDTGKWLLVIGRASVVGGAVSIAAVSVSLTTPPTSEAKAQAPSPPPERPKVPPRIVFSLPIDGDIEIPQDARIAVQFSNDLNEESIKGRVAIRYLGPELPGDRAFDAMRVFYDGGRRTIVVDAGDLLKPGRVLAVFFLAGITDTDGLALVPREARKLPEGVVEAVFFRIAP